MVESALSTRHGSRFTVGRLLGAPIVVVVAAISVASGIAVNAQPSVLVGAIAAFFLVLVIQRPRLALPLMVPLLVLMTPSQASQYGLTAILPTGICFVVVFWAFSRRTFLSVAWFSILPFALWLAVSYLITTGSTAGVDTRNQFLLTVGVLPLCVAGAYCGESLRRIELALVVAGIGASAVVLAGGQLQGGRLVGLGNNPNGLGLILAVAFVSSIGFIRRGSLLPIAASALIAWPLILTRSQGALIAASGGLLVIVLHQRTPQHRVRILLMAALLAVLILPRTGDFRELAVGSRTSSELELSTKVRTAYLEAGVRYLIAHPVRGVGFGRFPAEAAQDPAIGMPASAHNTYVGIGAETGFLGLLLLLRPIRRAFLAAPKNDDGRRAVAVLVTYALGFLFGTFLAHWQIVAPLWLLVGCLLGQPRRPNNSAQA